MRVLYERERNQRPERKQRAAEYQRTARRRHPDRFRARARLRWAMIKGLVLRLPCAICGSPNSQAHHADYSKPLEVEWYCFKHHRERAHGQTPVVP